MPYPFYGLMCSACEGMRRRHGPPRRANKRDAHQEPKRRTAMQPLKIIHL